MKPTNTQFERHVDIDRRVRAGEFPSVQALAGDWEVDERTIKRDIAFMRDRLMAPIEYDRKQKGYYYTEPTWGLPAISLRESELVALLLARQALEQYDNLPLGELLGHFYEQVLTTAGQQAGATPSDIFEGFSFVPPPSVPVESKIWNVLSEAVLKRRSVEFSYQSISADAPRTYAADPLHISNIEGEWYLFARSHYKGDILQFAISRMGSVKETGSSFDAPDDFVSAELKNKLFGRYASMQGTPETVRIRIDSTRVSQVHLKQWHADQKVIHRKNGSVEISFPVSSGGSKRPYANVISWVLSMGSHAKVLAPKRLKELVAEEIERMHSRQS
jgi:proteasome accessory factor B